MASTVEHKHSAEQKRRVKTAIPGPRSVELHAHRHCHANGVLVLTCGTYANVIRLLPPLVIGFDLLDDAPAVIAEATAIAEATKWTG